MAGSAAAEGPPSGPLREAELRKDDRRPHQDRKHAPPTWVGAKGAAKAARGHGYESAAEAESIYVRDVDGPLLDGEIDRRALGRQLAASITRAGI